MTLNTTPLEPLYSLKKLTHHKKRSTEKKRRATVADSNEVDGSEKPKKKQVRYMYR